MKMRKQTPTNRLGKWHDLGPLEQWSRSLNDDTVRSISFSAGEYTFELSLLEALSIYENLTHQVSVLHTAVQKQKAKEIKP